jgi:aspartyl-tRNA(Asn)/glutamyl-tRNA(Gln) amidotransferase subunit A
MSVEKKSKKLRKTSFLGSSDLQTIVQLHEAYKKKKVTCVEVVQIFLERIGKSQTNAFISVTETLALKQAKYCDDLIAAGCDWDQNPLLGIPVGIKDNISVKGEQLTCASAMLKGFTAGFDATVIERLKKAGAVILGKLNMDEFAMGGANEFSIFGSVRNPRDLARVAGGSSGGSAAAVAEGLCLLALGSDTGGSVRLPASFCGIVGLKPTYGTVSRHGLVAYGSSLDQIGILGNTVADVATCLEVISGQDEFDSTCVSKPVVVKRQAGSLKGVKFGFLDVDEILPMAKNEGSLVHKKVLDGQKLHLEHLQELGGVCHKVTLKHLRHSVAVYYISAVSEASSNLERFDGIRFGNRVDWEAAMHLDAFYAANRSLFGFEVKKRILMGTFALSSHYHDAYFKKACQVRRLIQQDFLEAFQAVDVIVHPVVTQTAFLLQSETATAEAEDLAPKNALQMYLNDLFTIPANLCGLASMSLPVFEYQGLPIGMQWTAKPFEDAQLLELGSCFMENVGGVHEL